MSTPRSRGDRMIDWLEERLPLSEWFAVIAHFGFVSLPLDTRRPLRELLPGDLIEELTRVRSESGIHTIYKFPLPGPNDADRVINVVFAPLVSREQEQIGRLILFDDITDYPSGFRVTSNPFTSYRRTARILRLPADLEGVELLNAYRQKIRHITPIAPIEVAAGPIFEIGRAHV